MLVQLNQNLLQQLHHNSLEFARAILEIKDSRAAFERFKESYEEASSQSEESIQKGLEAAQAGD